MGGSRQIKIRTTRQRDRIDGRAGGLNINIYNLDFFNKDQLFNCLLILHDLYFCIGKVGYIYDEGPRLGGHPPFARNAIQARFGGETGNFCAVPPTSPENFMTAYQSATPRGAIFLIYGKISHKIQVWCSSHCSIFTAPLRFVVYARVQFLCRFAPRLGNFRHNSSISFIFQTFFSSLSFFS